MPNDTMQDKKEMMDEGQPGGADTSEEYIQSVASSLENVFPEDFQPSSASISVDAEDGAQVAVLVTGIAQGGQLTNAKQAVINPSAAEPEKPNESNLEGRFGSKTQEEQNA